MYQRASQYMLDDKRRHILDFVGRLQGPEKPRNRHGRGSGRSKGSWDVVSHAGVKGVEERALEIGQDGVVGNPEDNLDPVRFRVAADVEAFVDLLAKL